MSQETYLFVLNAIGLIAFSFSGAIKAIIHYLDLFGIIFLGLSTALGGGAIRDIMVHQVPAMLTDINYVFFSLLGIVGAILVKGNRDNAVYTKIFLVSDGIGLASFTSSGCLVAYNCGLGPIGIIVLGIITAIGGGIIRDILVNEIPIVLNKELYATCSFVGCVIFWIFALIFDIKYASFLSVLTVFIIRMIAIKYRWNLPRFS
ncbi:MAG TPA: trimeric intracellular cation channel family protein [bacterium]|nr:trimeric intracellular cation channel family protein [bacterium]